MVRRMLLRLFPASSTAALLRVCVLAGLCLGIGSALPALASAASYAPVAEYSFDEGTGGTVEDLSGNGNVATVEGATWTGHGRYGGAMEFAGEAPCVTVPDGPQFQMGEEFTVEAWVRPDSAKEFAPVFFKEDPELNYGYVLMAGGAEGGHPSGYVVDGTWPASEIEATAELPVDVWSHLALSFDGARIRLYVDGELVASGESDAPVESKGPLRIGCGDDNGFWDHFDGRIDEARVYDRVLGQADIAADMEAPIETPKSGPVADWSFDEDNEATQADTSGGGHTGTVEGASWTGRGRYGGALEFDGEESCVSVPDSESLQLSEEFTLEAWVKSEGSPSANPILYKESGSGYSYAIGIGFTEEGHAEGWASDAGGSEHVSSPGWLQRDVWTHIAYTYDGGQMRLYVDGDLVADKVVGPGTLSSEGPLWIGCAPNRHEYFTGRIDEPRIYDRALDGPEVAADMEAPIQTPRQGPVAAFAFDEGEEAGETVEDVTGDGHTATIEDGTRGRGRYGGGIQFDGKGGPECVSVPDALDLRLSEEFTLEAWVRPEDGVFGDPVVVKESEGDDAFGLGLGLGPEEEETAGGFIGHGSGTEAAGGGLVAEKAWSHVATTYDGHYIRVYVDGELVATEDAPTPPLAGEGALKIGCDGPDGQFTGRIDEVRVYDRALNAGEVVGDMETPLQTPKATPVADYSFDEDDEATQADTSGGGHTATVEGAAWTAHGRYGGAMEFDAAEEDVLRIPASPWLSFSEEFTLEAWVRPSGEGNVDAPLIDKQEGGGLGYFLYEGGSESDVPFGAADPGQEHVHADEPLPANAWSHVALVFTGNRTYLYVDGEEVQNGAAEPLVGEEGELEIGGSTDTADFFDGRIDEVRIYNRGLDAAEVGSDMETPIQTPKQGPIAAWSFEEGEGATAEDVTGDEHEATIEGAEWARGKYGEGLRFDGEHDVVKVPNSPEFALTEGFTLEAWVRPESGSNEWAPILAKEMGGGEAAEQLAWWLYEGGKEANVPVGGIEPTPGKEELAGAEDPLPVDVWSHVALTYDGSQVVLYVNGELVDCSEAPSDGPRLSEGELQIGAATEQGDYFKGRIDEVKVYNRPLSGDEIQDSAPPRFDGGLKLFVNNTSGAEAPDVYFWEAEDPLNPDGSPGSGVAGYEYRYAVNGSAYTGWLVDSAPHFLAMTAGAGDELSVQVRAYDLADNRSEIYEASQIVPEAVEATEEAEEKEEGIFNRSTYVLSEPHESLRAEATEEPAPINENNVPPEVRKEFHQAFLHGEGCASVGTSPEVRLLNGHPYEVTDTYVKCVPETYLLTATLKVDLRKVVPGKAIAPIEKEEFFSVKGPATEVKGPYRTKYRCDTGQAREWLAETHANWFHFNPLKKKTWERSTSAGSGFVEDSCS